MLAKETGEIDIEKIPFKDRIAVEAMQNYQEQPGGSGKWWPMRVVRARGNPPRNGGDLCQQTPHSGEFLVCPAAKGCVWHLVPNSSIQLFRILPSSS